MYMPSTKWTWSFMGVTVFQCIVSLALEGYVFGRFQSSLDLARGGTAPSDALTIPTYLALFIFGFLYEVVLVWDALRLKNTIQVIGICIYNLGMLIYAAVEMGQVSDAINKLEAKGDIDEGTWIALRPYLIAAPCVIALCTVLLSFLAWKLYDEFAWTIYKHISADLRLKRRYLTYQIYIALLKFDFFFFLGFTVQFLVVVPNTSNFEKWLTVAALPITVVLLFFAAFFTRRESYAGQIAVIILYFAGMAYFVFKLVRMYEAPEKRVEEYKPARRSLTIFAVLTLIALVLTMVTAFVCMRNFNKGLKPHIQKREVPNADELKYTNYGPDQFNGPSHSLEPVPHRMTID
ncbi:hypothetical protein LTR78_006058 [Recurvomyces mirabilis]|uniref:Uncharacterized protein n=1 Tax=Recurvomyces mirabilis TaxID=574656 RepID=A0AAE0WM33_9PEZI|nr:hypothetical protein LTR78_006058 [Recurvomyces mirabilis]KAK5155132.1 hypothetical protein LTS14_006087 [Recurvomyces mirabilis]